LAIVIHEKNADFCTSDVTFRELIRLIDIALLMRFRLLAVCAFLLLPLLYSFNVESLGKKAKPVTRPVYSDEKFWIALPWRHDRADTLPPDCPTKENQAAAQVDVFYVHPTVYLTGSSWNGNLDDKRLNEKCDGCVMQQATPFNSCAKVYAPRYRQAVLRSFKENNPEGMIALDTAYADVKKSFEHYLANWNQGRPIILAGHSQGAFHVARLMDDFFTGKPLLKQLVAAYPIGFDTQKNRYPDIPVGDSASQTCCFVTWNTVAWGQDTTGGYTRLRGTACVNPLTWKQNDAVGENKLHLGAVRFDWKKTEKHLLRTKIHGSLLWIAFTDPSLKKGFYHLGTNYHVSDVNLFYMNIRENAELRVKTYLLSQ
jgi:hypothetical protein